MSIRLGLDEPVIGNANQPRCASLSSFNEYSREARWFCNILRPSEKQVVCTVAEHGIDPTAGPLHTVGNRHPCRSRPASIISAADGLFAYLGLMFAAEAGAAMADPLPSEQINSHRHSPTDHGFRCFL
jgi:hypothetical protein